jgi:hypothetical protein
MLEVVYSVYATHPNLRVFLLFCQLRGMTHHIGLPINTEIKKGRAGLIPSTAFLTTLLPLKPLFYMGLDL